MLLVPLFLAGLLVGYDLSLHSLAQIFMSTYRVIDSFMVLLTCIDSRFPSQLGAWTDDYAVVHHPSFLVLDIPPPTHSC